VSLTTRDGIAVISAALAALALGAAAYLLMAGAGVAISGDPGSAASPSVDGLGTIAGSSPDPAAPAELLVDVQGGVQHPGLVRLPPGARVADAVAAAGGYSPLADLRAAAAAVNLAAPLADGQQVFVPLQGVAGSTTGSGSGSGSGSLVNLNTASTGELEALPGIGPVTAEKIVTARQEQPFTTLDELVDRKVMNRGQLDGIRDLVTV
jgi:competence protein ComEA